MVHCRTCEVIGRLGYDVDGVPFPSFSSAFARAILDVEKAAYLGIEAVTRACCIGDVRRMVEKGRGARRIDDLGSDLGIARLRLLKDIVVVFERCLWN